MANSPTGSAVLTGWTGPYKGLLGANAALIDWGRDAGIDWAMTATGAGEVFDCRLEIYRIGPAQKPDEAEWVTEITIRIADGEAGS